MKAPKPFSDKHPAFRVNGWDSGNISAQDMVRHFLITGETGSGKSTSAVMPLLEAILRYPEPDQFAAATDSPDPADVLRPAVLVIDPKQELGALIDGEAGGRKVTRIAHGGPVLHFFEGWESIDAQAAMDFILQQSSFFVQDQARTDEPVWNMQAASILKDFVTVDLWLAKQSLDKVRELWDVTQKYLGDEGSYTNLRYNRDNYFQPMAALIGISGADGNSEPLNAYLEAAVGLGIPGDLLIRLVTLAHLTHTTRSGVIWMANGILADLASEEFAACVSVNPLESPEHRLSIKDSLNHGDVVIYVPPSTNVIADMIGRCLKSKFFEFAFERENQERPFFYVVDEAHRFITSGARDGEQSLLDRCRAYRTGVVLATQSLASMAHRLESGGGWLALQIMLNNCGNSLYFRTTDIATQDNLMKRIPGPPIQGRPHVLHVRPLSGLPVGQCYALRADGSWGLFHVHLGEQVAR